MNGASGDIVSPNYPQPYQIADCYWKIAVAAGGWIQLLIVDLDLEHHEKCRFDYIEIYEDSDPGNKQRFCSNPYPKVIQTKSNTLNVRFHTDYTNFGRGFHLKYETRESILSRITLVPTKLTRRSLVRVDVRRRT